MNEAETELVDAREAAEILGVVSPGAVQYLRKTGRLPEPGNARDGTALRYVFRREAVERLAADRLLRPGEAARFLGLNPDTVRKLAATGELREVAGTPKQGQTTFRVRGRPRVPEIQASDPRGCRNRSGGRFRAIPLCNLGSGLDVGSSVCRTHGSLHRVCRSCERGTGQSERHHAQRSSSAPAPALTPRSQRRSGPALLEGMCEGLDGIVAVQSTSENSRRAHSGQQTATSPRSANRSDQRSPATGRRPHSMQLTSANVSVRSGVFFPFPAGTERHA